MNENEVNSMIVKLTKAIREIDAFGKAKAAVISERRRKLAQIQDALLIRSAMDNQTELIEANSVSPEVRELIEDPLMDW